MKQNRREFIQQTGRAALSIGASAFVPAVRETCAAEERAGSIRPAPLPVIDTHQHLWDLSKLRLPWLKSAGKLNRSFLMKDYLAAVRGLNVVKAVYMEVAVDPKQHLLEAEHVVEICRRDDNPTCAAVIGGRPGSDGFRQYITRFKDSRFVKGVRQILPGKGSWPDKALIAGIRLLGELGMSFDLCTPPAGLRAGVKLVDQCPDTRFILDHCGNAAPKLFRREGTTKQQKEQADRWRRDVAELAKRKNIVCKISGIVARATPGKWTHRDLAPIVDHCLDTFGPDRVMFASDWPVCTRAATLKQWLNALKEIIRKHDEGEQKKLLHDNAAKFYGIQQPSEAVTLTPITA